MEGDFILFALASLHATKFYATIVTTGHHWLADNFDIYSSFVLPHAFIRRFLWCYLCFLQQGYRNSCNFFLPFSFDWLFLIIWCIAKYYFAIISPPVSAWAFHFRHISRLRRANLLPSLVKWHYMPPNFKLLLTDTVIMLFMGISFIAWSRTPTYAMLRQRPISNYRNSL